MWTTSVEKRARSPLVAIDFLTSRWHLLLTPKTGGNVTQSSSHRLTVSVIKLRGGLHVLVSVQGQNRTGRYMQMHLHDRFWRFIAGKIMSRSVFEEFILIPVQWNDFSGTFSATCPFKNFYCYTNIKANL